MSDSDDIFLKRFSMIIAGLVGITFAILFLADQAATIEPYDANPSRIALANDRIQPEAAVRTELTEATQLAAAPAPVTATPVAPEAISGSAVYASACQACHLAGAAGAPIPGTDAWLARAEQGLDVLSDHAINGINAMPAKGGRMDLSDAEVIAAVEHMLEQ